mmetsp:Transcript_23091/g.29000  ORF Transcript_23091/g.29000 Transcript_23091/m.29000 type:complete len:283 (+) Transcript_23091:91-939(+)
MRLKKIRNKVSFNLKNGKHKYAIETDKEDPQLPGLFVFSGSRGSGKTYAAVSLVSHFERKGYITRTFLLCPTHKSNPVFQNIRTLSESDSCDNDNGFQIALQQILQEIEEDWNKYEEELDYRKIWKKWHQHKNLSMKEDQILEERNYERPEKIVRPGHMLIIDDAQGTDLYSNNRKQDLMNHFTIKHRHIPLSICFLVQSWHGLPRVIRLNATHFALYKTGDKKQLAQIWENFGNLIEFEEFERLYKQATSQPHGFLFIDTVPKREYMRFRNGFNEFMVVNN